MSELVLTNRKNVPPDGYIYYEASLGWRMPKEVALTGLREAALALQQARANNPGSGLDPSYDACVEAIGAYTCARLANKPRLLSKFCSGGVVAEEQLRRAAARRENGGCAGCGRR